MKKYLFLITALLMSSSVFATSEHYILRDGNNVQHVKITKLGDELTVSADVDFEPGATGGKPCTADISGEAKEVSKDEIVLKKHLEGEARYCTLKLHVTPNGVKVEQSDECKFFAVGLCHFNSNDKELLKIK